MLGSLYFTLLAGAVTRFDRRQITSDVVGGQATVLYHTTTVTLLLMTVAGEEGETSMQDPVLHPATSAWLGTKPVPSGVGEPRGTVGTLVVFGTRPRRRSNEPERVIFALLSGAFSADVVWLAAPAAVQVTLDASAHGLRRRSNEPDLASLGFVSVAVATWLAGPLAVFGMRPRAAAASKSQTGQPSLRPSSSVSRTLEGLLTGG